MASAFKPAGKSKYSIEYTDENGRRRKATGTTDKAVSERISNDLENKVALRKAGIVDPKAEAHAKHAVMALADHLDAWASSLRSRGATAQHVKQHSSRARRVIALFKGARLVDIEPAKPATKTGVAKADAELRTWVSSARIADLTPENVQRSLALLIKEGRSLQTANHHRNAIKSFGKR